MQLKQIARDALLKPLQAVVGIVERRHTLPILANVLLEQRDGRLLRHGHRPRNADHRALRICRARSRRRSPLPRASCRTCCARFPEDSTLTVDVVGKPDDRARWPVALQSADAAGGRLSAHRALAQDASQALTLPQRELRGLLKSVEFAMAQQDIRYYLNGMLLVIDRRPLQAVATDGHRLVVGELAIGGDYPRRK